MLNCCTVFKFDVLLYLLSAYTNALFSKCELCMNCYTILVLFCVIMVSKLQLVLHIPS